MKNFYLNLPSTSGIIVNKQSNYTTFFTRRIYLNNTDDDGDDDNNISGNNSIWEVALSEYYIPKQKMSNKKVPNYYIYTDIIEWQLVGNALAPLLRVVPSNKIWQQFTNPYYFPVNRDILESINIKICDAEGSEIDFEKDDRIVCVLHFRRKQ